MDLKRYMLTVAVWAAIVTTLVLTAQEKDVSYPETRRWWIGRISINDAYVEVIDTAGVCLYVVETGIAAVPKTQIAPGKGCQ